MGRRGHPIVIRSAPLSILVVVAVLAMGSPSVSARRRAGAAKVRKPATSPLAAGSDPSVLPGPVLIADEGNDRLIEVNPHGHVIWQFPRAADTAKGQTLPKPDDAFFTPDHRHVIATQEENFTLSLVDIAKHRVVWSYGTAGVHGSDPNQLWNPDDALVLQNGDVLTADIKNCRLLVIGKGTHAPAQTFGRTGECVHNPPQQFGSPNGAFPMRNGHFLVTEINGDWVDEMDLTGTVFAAVHPPGIGYPSDTNEVKPGTYLTVDYSSPGTIETFDAQGALLWRYAPTGADALDHPSIAKALPNGDVIATDDHNHRVIVVDPRTNRIVWQYGHLGTPGSTAGYLNGPDGLDPAPPHSISNLVTKSKP
jgi:outer membrane protein assembly factor BamB